MARFRCPDSLEDVVSGAEVDNPVAESSKAPKVRIHAKVKATAKAKGKLRNSAARAEVKERIRLAQKVRPRKRKEQRPPSPGTIWVGNLRSDTTEAQLMEAFSTCGRVVEVTIRLFQGVPIYPVKGSKESLPENQMYASVTFYDLPDPELAMKKDGRILNGQRMIVRRDVSALLAVEQPKSYPSYSVIAQGWNQVKMLTVERTEVISRYRTSSAGPSKLPSAVPDAQDWLAKIKLGALKDVFPSTSDS